MGEVAINPKISKGILSYIISVTALGFAEYFGLQTLFWMTLIMSIFTSMVMIITLAVYTFDYCRKLCTKPNK